MTEQRDTRPMRIVIVGNGMAGSRLAEELRAAERDLPPEVRCAITVFGAEPHDAYNRVMLSHVLAGSAGPDTISLSSRRWAREQRVEVRLGCEIVEVDRDRREVLAADGSRTPYDYLVLATGSSAVIPELAGLREADGSLVAGAEVFRTVDDCAAIVEHATRASRALVLGGGLLGLEAARGLAERGLDVTVLHHRQHLMERQLDAHASRTLLSILRRMAVGVRTSAVATSVRRGDDGRLAGLELSDGTQLDADLLVISCGVRPRVELARAAGLRVGRAVLVDDQLRSESDERVFAIGECSEHDGTVYGLVAPAWEQAATVARVLTGRDTPAYRGSKLITRLKADGIELAAMGDVAPWLEDAHPEQAADVSDTGDSEPGSEVVLFADPARQRYSKLVLRDGRLVGAILIGNPGAVATLSQLFDRGSIVPPDRAGLIFGRSDSEPITESPMRLPDRSTICHCNGVTKGVLCKSFLNGNRTVRELAADTRATTGCGGCADTVAAIAEWLSAAEPLPVPEPVPDSAGGPHQHPQPSASAC